MKTHVTKNIAGVDTQLELFPINDETQIAAFILYGNVDVTIASAKELLSKVPEFDYILTAEAKGIPLAHEMARQAGTNNYVVARKAVKVYMRNCISTNVDSITTAGLQRLYLGESDYKKLEGKRVLIADDVISTGESLNSLLALCQHIKDCEIVGCCAVLAEGEAAERDDIIFCEKLDLYDTEGNPK